MTPGIVLEWMFVVMIGLLLVAAMFTLGFGIYMAFKEFK